MIAADRLHEKELAGGFLLSVNRASDACKIGQICQVRQVPVIIMSYLWTAIDILLVFFFLR